MSFLSSIKDQIYKKAKTRNNGDLQAIIILTDPLVLTLEITLMCPIRIRQLSPSEERPKVNSTYDSGADMG